MPTVIDALVVELGLDPRKFTEGQKDALESFKRTQDGAVKVGKDIESQGKKVDEYFSTLKRNALGLVAGFAAGYGIKEFTSYITNLDATTGRLAKTMNMSVKDLAAWQGAFEQNGGTAASATSALQGLSGEMNKFMLTGQTSMLPVLNSMGIGLFDANKNMKTSGQLLLEISDAMKGMDTARASAALSLIPGMNQDAINLLIQGRAAVEGYLAAAKAAGGTTDKSAADARRYQADLANLERTATDLGRTFAGLTGIFGGLSNVMNGLSTALKDLRFLPELLEDIARNVIKLLPDWAVKLIFGSKTLADVKSKPTGYSAFENAQMSAARKELAQGLRERAAGGQQASISHVPGSNAAEQEDYIRKAAIARGIDPNVAVAVAKSEGLNSTLPGQQSSVVRADGSREPSYGPFQLYMGGGLGNKFQKQTGLDPRDQSTWKSQVDFALDEAKKSGWGPWHGWKGLPNAGIGAAPAGAAGAAGGQSSSSSSSTSITVGKIELHSSKASPADVAAEIPEALRRANFAASANYAQTG